MLGAFAGLIIASWAGLALAQAETSSHTVAVGGAVKTPLTLTLAAPEGLPLASRLVKVGDASGRYRWTLEVEGVSLAALLDRVVIEKKHDDGFARPLDTLVVVKGRHGERAVLSWGEIYTGRDPLGFVLANRMRPYLPHHHAEADWSGFDPRAWHDVAGRETLKVESCGACHDGKGTLAPVTLPRGWCLAVAGDRWPPRFVEDVESIEVVQVVGAIAPGTPAGKRAATRVEAPALVAPDGKRTWLTMGLLARLPRLSFRDAAIGMGRGFHGTRVASGVALAPLVQPLIPKGADPLAVYVLVSGSDGYRSVLSGAELFASPLADNLVLVDREDGKPLAGDAGRYKVVVESDFFVDRGVRSLSEIRLGVVK